MSEDQTLIEDGSGRVGWFADGRRVSCVFTAVAGGQPKGALVYVGPALTAVLTHEDPASGLQGWHLEVGFGPCDCAPFGRLFPDLEDVLAWVETVSTETAPK